MAHALVATNPEQTILEQNCNKIISQINAYFSGIGAFKSSGRINAIKEEITSYLNSIGSPTAMQILKKYQQNGWKV